MKLRLGIVSIAVSITLGAVAVVWMHYAMVVAMLGVGFALVGIGLLCEATDPRRKPNPRTQHDEDWPEVVVTSEHVPHVMDLHPRFFSGPTDSRVGHADATVALHAVADAIPPILRAHGLIYQGMGYGVRRVDG